MLTDPFHNPFHNRLEFNEAELRNPTPANKPGEAKKTAANSDAGPGSPVIKSTAAVRTDALPPLPTAATTETTAQNTRRRLRPIGSPQ